MVNDEVKVLKNSGILKKEEIRLIQDLISNLKYGFLTLKIQDGVLIQIDKNENMFYKLFLRK